MFKVEIIGNLGADAEIKESNGTKFVTMRIAHTDKYKDASGVDKETTTWVDVTYNNTESKVLEYLKQGVKLFVRGNARLRVYSSPKDRMMKAGISISASEIELCGGSSDDVPKRLVDPDTAMLYDISKHYWCNYDTSSMKDDELRPLIDERNRLYGVNKAGFVMPAPNDVQGQYNKHLEAGEQKPQEQSQQNEQQQQEQSQQSEQQQQEKSQQKPKGTKK